MNTPTRYTVSYFHLTESDTPDYGLPWFFNGLAPANRHSYFGFPDQNYLRTSDDIITGKVDHDFGHGASFHSIAPLGQLPATPGIDHRAADLLQCVGQRARRAAS